MQVPSPCINLCSMGDDGFCDGCLRTTEEILFWDSIAEEMKLHIVNEIIPERHHSRETPTEK